MKRAVIGRPRGRGGSSEMRSRHQRAKRMCDEPRRALRRARIDALLPSTDVDADVDERAFLDDDPDP